MFYIATFFSHFGAIRDLSSSCGTCVRCEERYVEPSGVCASEIDQIVRAEPDGYVRVYQAKERNDGN